MKSFVSLALVFVFAVFAGFALAGDAGVGNQAPSCSDTNCRISKAVTVPVQLTLNVVAAPVRAVKSADCSTPVATTACESTPATSNCEARAVRTPVRSTLRGVAGRLQQRSAARASSCSCSGS